MKTSYLQKGVLKLDGFLKDSVYNELIKLILDIKGEQVKIPDRCSYQEMGDLSGVGKLFSSKEFLSFVSIITGKSFSNVDLNIRKFENGDYTLLHDSDKIHNRTEFFFIFADKWNAEWGGQIVYTDLDERSFIFPVDWNCFCLINRDDELGRFVKYINHLAGKKCFILIEGWAG